MKNNKGFTLIELLAVIVLLVTISAIAIPSITASIERSKARQSEAKIMVIVEAAKLYYSSHKNTLNNNGFSNNNCYISVNDLDLTEKELENPLGGSYAGGVFYDSGEFTYSERFNDGFPACGARIAYETK